MFGRIDKFWQCLEGLEAVVNKKRDKEIVQSPVKLQRENKKLTKKLAV